MTRWTFLVQGRPKAQPRPKAFRRGDRASVYDPGTAAGWKAAIVAASIPIRPQQPLTGCIAIELTFQLPRPKSLPKRMPGVVYCPKKPDWDNLAKAAVDAMTEAGWWRDDGQIVHAVVRKFYHALDQRPSMLVVLEEVGVEESR